MYFPKVYFRKCIFRKCIFWKCIFQRCIFRKCIFQKCIFQKCIFWECIFFKCIFRKCIFESEFYGSVFFENFWPKAYLAQTFSNRAYPVKCVSSELLRACSLWKEIISTLFSRRLLLVGLSHDIKISGACFCVNIDKSYCLSVLDMDHFKKISFGSVDGNMWKHPS